MFQQVDPLRSAERFKVIAFDRSRFANIDGVEGSSHTEVALGGECLFPALDISEYGELLLDHSKECLIDIGWQIVKPSDSRGFSIKSCLS